MRHAHRKATCYCVVQRHKDRLYKRTGEDLNTYIRSEEGSMHAFQGTACARVNHFHHEDGLPCYYAPEPSTQLSEEEEQNLPAGWHKLQGKPDVCAWDLRNALIHDIIEGKGR